MSNNSTDLSKVRFQIKELLGMELTWQMLVNGAMLSIGQARDGQSSLFLW